MRSTRLLSALLMAGAVVASPAMARHHHASATLNSSQNCTQNLNTANSNANCVAPANGSLNCATPANANCAASASNNPNDNPTLATADSLLQQSSAVVSQLQSDNNAVNLMRSAKGVFIIPQSSGVANTSAGAEQGGGVLLTNDNGRWSDPVFFSLGSAVRGNQPASANNGQVALFIMSDRAMKEFRGGTASLNTRRLNIVNYASGSQQAIPANADLVVWSGNNNPPNTNMLSGIGTIRSNAAFDKAVYGTRNMQQIIAGRAPLTNQLAVNLSTQTPAPQPLNQIGMRDTARRPG